MVVRLRRSKLRPGSVAATCLTDEASGAWWHAAERNDIGVEIELRLPLAIPEPQFSRRKWNAAGELFATPLQNGDGGRFSARLAGSHAQRAADVEALASPVSGHTAAVGATSRAQRQPAGLMPKILENHRRSKASLVDRLPAPTRSGHQQPAFSAPDSRRDEQVRSDRCRRRAFTPILKSRSHRSSHTRSPDRHHSLRGAHQARQECSVTECAPRVGEPVAAGFPPASLPAARGLNPPLEHQHALAPEVESRSVRRGISRIAPRSVGRSWAAVAGGMPGGQAPCLDDRLGRGGSPAHDLHRWITSYYGS